MQGVRALIGSRRLAREWALKILYQADVGKMSIEESQAAALERLRMEFVQRGSRATAGSLVEEYCLNAVTAHLIDLLPQSGPAVDAGLRECLARTFGPVDYWKRLDVEFAFSRQSYNALWETPRCSTPIVLPFGLIELPPSISTNPKLTDEQHSRLLRFLSWSRTALPDAAIRAFARETQIKRPAGANLKATQEYVQQRWRQFANSIAERWTPSGQAVEKHTCDWMRVASFTLKLVTGVYDHREELDASLQTLATGWAIDRQVSVDRNILRMAAFELAYLDNIPASATINEAVELAKKYSTAESGRFVNGLLGAIVTQIGAAASASGLDERDALVDFEVTDVPEIELDEIANEEELARV
jgi:transcription antitermination factor NusB